MNDICDLLGTPDAPVSKIASVNGKIPVVSEKFKFPKLITGTVLGNYIHLKYI